MIAMAKNAVLERYAEPAMLVARARTWRSEQTEHVYTETDEYQAGTWNHARRVVIKAEVPPPRPRTAGQSALRRERQTPRFLYEKVYCARGDAENRIKELKALQIDRTSCFSANQLRVLLTAAAYHAGVAGADTACGAQVPWLRDRLLKLGGWCARRVASSCACRARHRTWRRGGTSRSRSGRAPDSARPPHRRPSPGGTV